jgi:hypothetical protein
MTGENMFVTSNRMRSFYILASKRQNTYYLNDSHVREVTKTVSSSLTQRGFVSDGWYELFRSQHRLVSVQAGKFLFSID